MRMEIEHLMLFLMTNRTGIVHITAVHCITIVYSIEQNAALAENRREIEKLQEQISATSVQLLVERQKSKGYKELVIGSK